MSTATSTTAGAIRKALAATDINNAFTKDLEALAGHIDAGLLAEGRRLAAATKAENDRQAALAATLTPEQKARIAARRAARRDDKPVAFLNRKW